MMSRSRTELWRCLYKTGVLLQVSSLCGISYSLACLRVLLSLFGLVVSVALGEWVTFGRCSGAAGAVFLRGHIYIYSVSVVVAHMGFILCSLGRCRGFSFLMGVFFIVYHSWKRIKRAPPRSRVLWEKKKKKGTTNKESHPIHTAEIYSSVNSVVLLKLWSLL